MLFDILDYLDIYIYIYVCVKTNLKNVPKQVNYKKKLNNISTRMIFLLILLLPTGFLSCLTNFIIANWLPIFWAIINILTPLLPRRDIVNQQSR